MAEVLSVVVPVFSLIVLGVVAQRTGYVTAGADKLIVEFVFRVAIPALLFRTLATAAPAATSPVALWGAFFMPIAIVWVATTLLAVFLLRRPPADGAVLSLGAVFGNLLLLGLPLALGAFGPEAATPMALIFLIELPVMWLAATLQLGLSLPRGANGAGALWPALRSTALDLARNPIILAIAAGALWRLSGLAIPGLADRALSLLGQAAAPGSLFAIGLTLGAARLSGEGATVGLVIAMKMLVLPAIAWWAAFGVFDLPPVWAGVIVLFAALPTGGIAYLFAVRHARAEGSISTAVALSIMLSALTVTATLYLLAANGIGQTGGAVVPDASRLP